MMQYRPQLVEKVSREGSFTIIIHVSMVYYVLVPQAVKADVMIAPSKSTIIACFNITLVSFARDEMHVMSYVVDFFFLAIFIK